MKILIVEDEIHIARLLEQQLARILKGVAHEIERAGFLEEAIAYLDKKQIDLLLLDLNLAGEDGFEVLQFLSAGPFHTIVVSAYKNRAVEAFDYGVIDFVPKPFSEERLKKAIARISTLELKPEFPIKYFAIRKKGKIQLLEDQEVVYFQACGHYSRVHLKNGSSELHDKSLIRLMPLLSDAYERVHKSYIVKMSEIRDILVSEGGKYELELKSGALIPLGRSKYRSLKEKWLI